MADSEYDEPVEITRCPECGSKYVLVEGISGQFTVVACPECDRAELQRIRAIVAHSR